MKKTSRSKSKPKAKKKTKVKTKSRPAAKRVASAGGHAATAARRVLKPSGDATRFWRRERYKTLGEFWPFYLNEHAYAFNRNLHFIGSSLGLTLAIAGIATLNFWLLIPAFVSGYAFAWFGHFFIEKNRPATFTYPLKSFISDWRMWYAMLTGRVRSELKKFGIESK